MTLVCRHLLLTAHSADSRVFFTLSAGCVANGRFAVVGKRGAS